MEILIYHPRQTGDVIIGSHCARLVKKKYPEAFIIFVTGDHIAPLIEPCPWIDLTLPQPMRNKKELVRPEDYSKTLSYGEWKDLADDRNFEIMCNDWKPDKAYRPRWSPSPPHTVAYKPPYMFRCYASCCELTPEESDDTAYELPVSRPERDLADQHWNQHRRGERRILLHMDHLDPSFKSLVASHRALPLDTSGKTSWRSNLAIIAQADFVVTRYGGVAVMAASVGSRTITIPKPEPTLWAAPVLSHPGRGHVMLLPSRRCEKYEGTDAHRMQPCQPRYGSFVVDDCVLDRENTHPPHQDGFHCWRDVTVEDVQRCLTRLVDSGGDEGSRPVGSGESL